MEEMEYNIRKRFAGTRYTNIYTLINDVGWHEKNLVRGTYLVTYLNEVIMDHLLIDLDFDEEFEKDQQQLIWIVEFNKGRPFKIVLIRKLK